MYLSWLQAGFSHHTRQPNWWSVHQRRLASSCCPPFRQPPTSYKACVYGWQRQASSFKSSNLLPPKRSRDFCSLATHELGFESHRAYLGHVMPSYTGSGTSCAKHSSVGSSITFIPLLFFFPYFFFRTFFPYFFLHTFFSPCFFKLLYFYNRSYWRRMSILKAH